MNNEGQEKKAVIRVEGIKLRFGGVQALSGVSLDIKEREILAIIGPNGAGKTCVFNCINGFYHPMPGKYTTKTGISQNFGRIKSPEWGLLEHFRISSCLRG